ncbi:uncharacterized protein RB166_012106 [Leptodactylus fuscus]
MALKQLVATISDIEEQQRDECLNVDGREAMKVWGFALFKVFNSLAVALALISTVLTAPLPMDRNEELIDKIKLQVMEIKNSMDLKEENLKLIRTLLNIFPISLEQCKSGSFNQDACYTQLSNSLKSMYSFLSSVRLNAEINLTDLLYDLQEFISNVEEMMTKQGIPIDTHVPQTLPNTITEFQEKAGIFLILHDLENALNVFQEGLAAQLK